MICRVGSGAEAAASTSSRMDLRDDLIDQAAPGSALLRERAAARCRHMSSPRGRASSVSWRGEIGRMQRCRSPRIGACIWFAGHPITTDITSAALTGSKIHFSRGVNAAPGTSSVKADVGSRKREATMAYSPSSGTGSRSKPDKSTLTEAAQTLLAASGSPPNTDALERAAL